MSTHPNRLSLTIIATCITVSALTTLATYYITTKDTPLIGGPTYTHHGWPLPWITETQPTQPTINYEPLNYLNNTLIYTLLFMTISITILHTKTRKIKQQAQKLTPKQTNIFEA
jgi:phosphatidylserine synthase